MSTSKFSSTIPRNHKPLYPNTIKEDLSQFQQSEDGINTTQNSSQQYGEMLSEGYP
jgi:hypothetical protein